MIELLENELYIFEGKILRLVKLAFNKNSQEQGLRPILKQLSKEELNELIIKEQNVKN